MLVAATLLSAQAPASSGPLPAPAAAPIVTAKDIAYPGEIRLAVDASDVARRLVRVHETINGVKGDIVLLYPEWLPGEHGPEGRIDFFAGLKITAGGTSVAWLRDTVNLYAFHLRVPAGASAIDIEFEYLSPTSPKVGPAEMSNDILMLEWNSVVLYPAEYFTRQIPVRVELTLPTGWHFGSALDVDSSDANRTSFKRTSVETLVDSPVFAGRYTSRIDLDPNAAVPVHLDLFADRPELLAIKPEQIEIHRALIRQAYKLFGSHHYNHYDFLYSLSDHVRMIGLEHHQSSEDGTVATQFTEWDKQPWLRDLLPHEFTHSWNGKFRRPADLWTPNYNVPMRDSLLWVYEGQTQFWGQVLAARSGLWTKQQALDELAMISAYLQATRGREWRALQDTTNDEIVHRGQRFVPWRSWQRMVDYYTEGELIWLDVDTLIRERSQGRRSLDDFARSFFGINDGSMITVTYTFEDVVKALNAVEPYNWGAFLRERLDAVGKPAPLAGIERGGYKLVFNETQSDYSKDVDSQRKRLTLLYSVGLVIDEKDASVLEVLWDSPAFKAELTESMQILAVNGIPYSADVLKAAIQSAKGSDTPIALIVKTQDRYRVVNLDYRGGLRFPHLERNPSVPARLDDLYSPR